MVYREEIKVDRGIDNTFKFLIEGYRYIPNQRRRLDTNMFETRLLGGQKAVCLTGEDGASLFYDNDKFRRADAMPKRVLKTLFGQGGLQTLDDDAHKNRKELFMSLMGSERISDIAQIFKQRWDEALDEWDRMSEVNLYEEANKILTITICEWAGVPLRANEVEERTKDLNALFEAGGAVGLRHWQGRAAREKTEKWAGELIDQVRNGQLDVPEEKALYKMSWHRKLDGELMSTDIAAVELVNILRPTVAVSVYIAFCALALHDHPQEKEKLRDTSNESDFQMFVQEVRRYYPFFPILAARVRHDFVWNGHDFKEDQLVILDLYGTNHHPNLWDKPNEFIPERFEDWNGTPFDFIPQGGGDYYMGHRCPGEWLTIEIMKACLDMMVNHMEYDVPPQDLDFSMNRMPSLPKSRFIMTNVKRK
ncbi:cytochrome P450 [Virgibacillus sp. MSJ-26]|uniref:cytochrome P450 n=1 Tax=Virgibacillus sp. MSJ-26 TaxID=2841522 RepID=UPI001C1119E4|nr:cytochrome P450 [Virgibacillus sp. MSJ-26]MBU5466834.1 cytochrome P450 [Virgibacillus sp. MSJ-26]